MRKILSVLATAIVVFATSCGPIPRNSSANVRSYFDDESALWYYVILDADGGCYYYSSPTELSASSFNSSTNWTYSSQAPSSISDDQYTEFELDANLLEPEVMEDPSLDLQTEAEIGEGTAESFEPEASDGFDSDFSDGGSDGGGGGDGGGGE